MNISCTVICPLNLVQLRCIKTMLVVCGMQKNILQYNIYI